jgi:hypothetical protein
MSQPPAAAETVQGLLTADEHLPEVLRSAILGHGQDAVPALLAILEDEELAIEEPPDGSWAPNHAAALLGELRAIDAIGPMLRVLAETDPFESIHDAVMQALAAMGAVAVEPLLQAHAEESEPDLRADLASVLGSTGVRDDRILAALVDALPHDPEGIAADLAKYGDSKALPALSRAFDEYEYEYDDAPLAAQVLGDLQRSIEGLGGSLTASQVKQLDHAKGLIEQLRKEWRTAAAAVAAEPGSSEEWRGTATPIEPARRVVRPGRNDACWCGSGTKYKKCHLQSDEDGSTAPPAQA